MDVNARVSMYIIIHNVCVSRCIYMLVHMITIVYVYSALLEACNSNIQYYI